MLKLDVKKKVTGLVDQYFVLFILPSIVLFDVDINKNG